MFNMFCFVLYKAGNMEAAFHTVTGNMYLFLLII